MYRFAISLRAEEHDTLIKLRDAHSFQGTEECLQTLLSSFLARAFTELPDEVLSEEERLKKRIAAQDKELILLRHLLFTANENDIRRAMDEPGSAGSDDEQSWRDEEIPF